MNSTSPQQEKGIGGSVLIASHPTSPLVHVPVCDTHTNTEPNRTNSSFASCIQDVRTMPVSLKNLPIVVMDRIASFCSLKDIKHMRKADVYPEINSVRQSKVAAIKNKYSEVIRTVHEWKVSSGHEEEKNRNSAVKRIMDCIFGNKSFLDLSGLNLKSLPDISSLKFLAVLNYQGNDTKPIYDCLIFESLLECKIKESSLLPESLVKITVDAKPDFFNWPMGILPPPIRTMYIRQDTGPHPVWGTINDGSLDHVYRDFL